MAILKFYHIVLSSHAGKSKGIQFSRFSIPLLHEPNDHANLMELEQTIGKKFNLTRPVIHSWQLLREEDTGDEDPLSYVTKRIQEDTAQQG